MEIKRSRFLTRIRRVATEDDARAVIEARRSEFFDARHHCSAFILGPDGRTARSSDDGEPAGTAGIPMLTALQRNNLTDVVAVVTRYFGGIKLGAGGLVRAYSSAVSETLDRAALLDRKSLAQVQIAVPHGEAGRIDNALRDWAVRNGAVLGDAQYAASAVFELWCAPERISVLQADVAALTAGAVAAHITGVTRVIDVPR